MRAPNTEAGSRGDASTAGTGSELVALVKKLEEEQARQTKERTDLLATIDRTGAPSGFGAKLRLAKSMPKPPAKDDSVSRLLAAQNRAHGDELKNSRVAFGAKGPRDRAGERECESDEERDDLTTERDALRRGCRTKLGHATLARQLITLENRATEAAREQNRAADREAACGRASAR